MISNRRELDDAARTLKEAGWSVLPPEQHLSDMDKGFLGIWERVRPFTLISPERGWALSEALRYLCRRRIPGDIVECGVWKGGACLLASIVLNNEEPESERTIWLYDTFEGMPAPGDQDHIAAGGQALKERNPEGWWAAGEAEVRKTLEFSPFGAERFHLVPGLVEKTLEETLPERIALLRLDTDWYESTRKELEVLYPRLVSGGILIIDDYGHFTGARKAVDEYFSALGRPVLMHRSDYTAG